MKTVMDAVNEFKGIAPEPCYAENKDQIRMAVKPFAGYLIGELTTGYGVRDNEYWKVICTREQFNTLVQECMTNFGRSGTYDEYKRNVKGSFGMVEDKVGIDWSKAPEGATGHSNDNQYYGECWYKNINEDSFYCMPISSMEWIHSFDTWQLEERKVTTRHKPQPIFTKAMQDAGELPCIGMEVSFDRMIVTIVGFTLKGMPVFEMPNGTVDYFNSNNSYRPIDTRTDKEKAIDDLIESYRVGVSDSAAKDACSIMMKAIQSGKIHGVKWVGKQ